MGLEFITQPQVFTQRLTALGGIEGAFPPYIASFFTWTSTVSVPTSSFSLPGSGVLLDMPGAFIVSVGGVLQSPTNYTINIPARTVNFDFVVNPNTDIVVTQIGTVGLTSTIDSLSTVQFVTTNLSSSNIYADNLVVTSLTALSSILHFTNITQFELSGYSVNGLVRITEGGLQTTNLTAGSAVMMDLSSSMIRSSNISADRLDLVTLSTTNNLFDLDPILRLGETSFAGLSGFQLSYNISNDRLLLQSLGPTLSTNLISINRRNGFLGLSATPNQALTVVGNISATGDLVSSGFIKATNTWPNRQYAILSADDTAFPGNSFVLAFSSRPMVLQPNLLYATNFSVLLSSTSPSTTPTPRYSIGLSASQPFTILEGWGNSGSLLFTLPGNPYLARDMRELSSPNAGTQGRIYTIFPDNVYQGIGPHSWAFNAILSCANTTQIILSCWSDTTSRVKSVTQYQASIIQHVQNA